MIQEKLRNPDKLFWLLQSLGWGGFIILNYVQGLAWEMKPDYFLPSLLYGIFGFFLTLLLRPVYKLLWTRPPVVIAVAVVLVSILAAGIFDAYKTAIYIWLYPDSKWQPQIWLDYIKALPLSLYVILAWSSLYFAIKSWRSAQQQHERALQATNVAHQAQLTMLRYQLNPHFLFNTLNAISTLVLEGNSKIANRMITELSAFLRHSLDRNPSQKVTLKTELDNLNRYLTIEKVRFGERLQVVTEIDPSVWSALVPSLILQPLIENAVKYAIADSETGGQITISVQLGSLALQDSSVKPKWLTIRVEDNGPGLTGPEGSLSRDNQSSDTVKGSGIGLTNTQERLQVLYGKRHQLQIVNIEPRGLAVSLSLPLEYD